MRSLAAAAAGTMMLVSLVSVTAPAEASTVRMPGKVTSVTATAGPGPGQVTFHWKASGTHTTSFHIETALSSFKVGDPKLPDHGRNSHVWVVSAKARSFTLTAAQLKTAGASVTSANHLYYRFRAMDTTKHGTKVRHWPYQQSVAVMPEMPSTDGTPLRVASFNVRSAKVSGHAWLPRAPLVAKEIIAADPGIVAVQELGPGRADGKDGSTVGSIRQTDDLVKELYDHGAGQYQLVRSTSFIKPGTTEGSQGARILYDTNRFALVTNCPQTTDGSSYNPSCSITLPIRSSDSKSITRRSSYAEFQDLSTGGEFFVASLHLDERHSTNATTEKSYETLRGQQMATVIARMKALNTDNLPVIIAGDLNSWQNNQHGDRAHDALISAGYYDTAAAKTQVNTQYTTYNNFVKTITVNPSGWGARLDVIAIKGVTGATKFENVMKKTNSDRPSDHNLVYTDLTLPAVS
jgi:endonuclease/exonuclease/phosphatase family metal-dependent hydrolase